MARVPHKTIRVSWRILDMVMRMESEELTPEIERLTHTAEELREEIVPFVAIVDMLLEDLDYILKRDSNLKSDMTPVWEDTYNLCGNPECDGECRVCQEGEEDYEEDFSEKYCRRSKR